MDGWGISLWLKRNSNGDHAKFVFAEASDGDVFGKVATDPKAKGSVLSDHRLTMDELLEQAIA